MKQFFEDGDGNLSMMRLIIFLFALAAIISGLILKNPVITGVFIAASTGGKIGQKFVEKKK